MKRICALSDLHGHIGEVKVKETDYLLIGGDIIPLEIQSTYGASIDWLENKFVPWIRKQPVLKKTIVVAGNHDFVFERHEEKARSILELAGIAYLNLETWENSEIKVLGIPWCKQYGFWAFMKPDSILKDLYSDQVKDDVFKDTGKTTILLSHDAPYGTSDIVTQDVSWNTGDHIGSVAMKELIERIQPDYNLHGHLHTTNHDEEVLGKTKVYCVSVLNEDYEVTYDPLYLTVE